MTLRHLTVAALAASLGLAASAFAASGSFKIAYKPSGRIDYDVRQLDRMADRADKGEKAEKDDAAWQLSDVHQIIGQEVVATPEGKLMVEGQVLAESVFSSDEKDERPAPLTESRPFRYEMTPQGGLSREPDSSDATAVMLPVFPDKVIAPGEKWEVKRPVAPGIYVPLTVSHEFHAVEVVDGMPCAVILSQGQSKESSKDGKQGCAMKGNGRTVVSLTDGQLVSFEAFTSLALKTTPSAGGQTNVMRRETLRTVVRRKPAPDAK